MSVFTQWAMVADVWFLAPTSIKEGETPEDFARRVQLEISREAGLIPRQWDGYLKYVNVNDKMKNEQKNYYARQLGLIER